MQIFYAPDITGKSYVLDENESRHTIKVLRMKAGDEVRLVDGKGNLFYGVISYPDYKECKINITGLEQDFGKRNYNLHLAISPLKNPERFEWFIEKSVEIGVDIITPVICKNTEKKGFKAERINNIIVSAMKQSVKALRPTLNEPALFNEFVRLNSSRNNLMIACCNDNIRREKISSVYHGGQDPLILIGPEGDFTSEEVELALSLGYKAIHLGKSRLRTETAGLAACHSIYFINQ